MKHCWQKVLHFALFEIELLALLFIILYSALVRFRPIGIMTSAEGDVLRYRFAEGQDELLSRCQHVQIAFATKDVPTLFMDPRLLVRDVITPDNRYAWHEVRAPLGTMAFRFDIHWRKNAQPSQTGPELDGIWLGKRRISWPEMKNNYELYEPLTVPCYRFRPELFFNLNGTDIFKYILGYIFAVNALLLVGWFVFVRRKKA